MLPCFEYAWIRVGQCTLCLLRNSGKITKPLKISNIFLEFTTSKWPNGCRRQSSPGYSISPTPGDPTIFEKPDVLQRHPITSGYQGGSGTHTWLAMLLRGERRPSAVKPLLRYLSLTVIALLVGISVGHAIDARGPGDGSKSDTTGRRRRNLPTVDPPRGIDGAVALEGSIGTQGYDDSDNNGVISSNQGELCMCLLLIVRDEESNLKANLPLWRDVAHCYVIGVDDRTTDGTMQAIHEALDEDTPRYDRMYVGQVCARQAHVRPAVLAPSLGLITAAVCSWRRGACSDTYAWKNARCIIIATKMLYNSYVRILGCCDCKRYSCS